MDRLTVKSSTIFIATRTKTRVYRSVDEVPPRLRKRLEETTNGINSVTILIADRRGREEIMRAIQTLPSSVRSKLSSSWFGRDMAARDAKAGEAAGQGSLPRVKRNFLGRYWAELLIPVLLGLIMWLVYRIAR